MTTLFVTRTLKSLIFKDGACRVRLTVQGSYACWSVHPRAAKPLRRLAHRHDEAHEVSRCCWRGDAPNSQYAHPPASGFVKRTSTSRCSRCRRCSAFTRFKPRIIAACRRRRALCASRAHREPEPAVPKSTRRLATRTEVHRECSPRRRPKRSPSSG
jgi:hypothetical protein